MRMIKLDSGDYINTGLVVKIINGRDQKHQIPVIMAGDNDFTWVSDADRDRIVEAINGKPYKPITQKLHHRLESEVVND